MKVMVRSGLVDTHTWTHAGTHTPLRPQTHSLPRRLSVSTLGLACPGAGLEQEGPLSGATG